MFSHKAVSCLFSGLIYEDGGCVTPSDCPCEYHGMFYPSGQMLQEECNNWWVNWCFTSLSPHMQDLILQTPHSPLNLLRSDHHLVSVCPVSVGDPADKLTCGCLCFLFQHMRGWSVELHRLQLPRFVPSLGGWFDFYSNWTAGPWWEVWLFNKNPTASSVHI